MLNAKNKTQLTFNIKTSRIVASLYIKTKKDFKRDEKLLFFFFSVPRLSQMYSRLKNIKYAAWFVLKCVFYVNIWLPKNKSKHSNYVY